MSTSIWRVLEGPMCGVLSRERSNGVQQGVKDGYGSGFKMDGKGNSFWFVEFEQ